MFSNLRKKILALALVVLFGGTTYEVLWARYFYLITAYCNCPICINVKEFQDGRFANGKKIYWGGVAAPPEIPFGTKIELIPFWPVDFFAINRILRNKRTFQVEDRGGMIKGKHIDLFIPDSLGGHRTALSWGRRWMRLKLDGKLAE